MDATGAGRGLGRQHALLLASCGARVVVNDLGGSVTGDGSGVDANSVATSDGGQAIIDTAIATWDRIDILN